LVYIEAVTVQNHFLLSYKIYHIKELFFQYLKNAKVFIVTCVVFCNGVALSEMDEDPNQLIEAPEDDDINYLNDETFGDLVENCMSLTLDIY